MWIPPEVKAGEDKRESVFVIEGSSNVGDARALIRLYVRLDEEAPRPTDPLHPPDSAKKPANKFQDVHVIRFEEGAPQ